jgi:hypothetical protein
MDTRKVKAIEIRLDELCDDPITGDQLYEEYCGKGMKLFEVGPIVLPMTSGLH